jgi:Reverse transcriptase (RNA-dependent DNA polymerase)
VKPKLQSLINDTAGGDVQLLADLINNALLRESRDRTSLSDISVPEITDIPNECIIQLEEVFNLLLHVKTHKSPSSDDIPNWFLKVFAFVIADPVCHIFNESFSSGVVPDIWKRANVVLISQSNPLQFIHDDLPPTSLTVTLGKLLESLIGHRQLPKIVDKLDSKQFGALRGRSTTHALTAITHMWHQALDDRASARSLFVDCSKTFDHVDHSIVMSKMAALSADPCMIRWMHSFLSNRQQRVKIGSTVSQWTTLTGRMPQGTWFGPHVFFMLYVTCRKCSTLSNS